MVVRAQVPGSDDLDGDDTDRSEDGEGADEDHRGASELLLAQDRFVASHTCSRERVGSGKRRIEPPAADSTAPP